MPPGLVFDPAIQATYPFEAWQEREVGSKRVRTSLSFIDAIQGLSNAQVIKVFRNLAPTFRKQIEFTLQMCVEKLSLFWKSSYTHTCTQWEKCSLLQQVVSVDTTVLRKGISYYS